MKKLMKKMMSVLCTLVMMTALFVPTTVMASEGPCWTKVKGQETWTYTDGQGTELVAKIQGNTLYIQGKGAIPSYSRDVLGNRPWHNKVIYSIIISDEVTSIGAEAFSNMVKLHDVTMPVSAFIEDSSAFAGAPKDCIFYFKGTNIVSRNIGNVPYNSVDSIVALMQKYNGVYQYHMDNYYMTTWVQNTVLPKIDKLSPVDAKSTYYNINYPIINYQSELNFVSPPPEYTMNTSIVSKQQGKAALEVFSIVLGENTYVTAYNMAVNNAKGIVKSTDTPLTYRITIPSAFQYPGRQFSLIQLGNGFVNILTDEDMDDGTLTFTTNYPSTVYALVYQDAVVKTAEVEIAQ